MNPHSPQQRSARTPAFRLSTCTCTHVQCSAPSTHPHARNASCTLLSIHKRANHPWEHICANKYHKTSLCLHLCATQLLTHPCANTQLCHRIHALSVCSHTLMQPHPLVQPCAHTHRHMCIPFLSLPKCTHTPVPQCPCAAPTLCTPLCTHIYVQARPYTHTH